MQNDNNNNNNNNINDYNSYNNNNNNNYPVNNYVPGRTQAIISLVCGIIAVILCFTGKGAIIGIILGIVGIVMSRKAKKLGFVGGMQTAGFVLSLISVIVCLVAFIIAIALVGVLFAAAT
ncbi:MAG: hypothetical protein IKD89_01755 [Clostridia bacterium]|nr:hypothetical protein [Clostridia bacterium]